MMKNSRFCGHKKVYGWLLAVICCLFLTACAEDSLKSEIQGGKESISLDDIPEYSGEPYVEINGNEPDFPDDGSGEESFETYSELDSLGRCGVAYASVGADLMPTGERESISQVKPTGWQTVKY